MTADRLTSLLRETRILLVDFAGPACSVFAGLGWPSSYGACCGDTA